MCGGATKRCPLESVVFNNPLNKVQTEVNVAQGPHRRAIKRKICEGFIIDNLPFYSARPDSAHFNVDISL